MSDNTPSEISTDDLKGQIAQRDNDGKLIAEDHTIELNGQERTVKTKPITTGLLNELSHIDEAVADLEPDAVREAFQTIYLSDAILALTEQEIRDMKASALKALLAPLEDAVEEEFGDEAGNDQQVVVGQERAVKDRR